MAVDPLLPLDVLLHASAGTLAVPETWSQGRGAFGGFVTGAMVHALEASAPDRPLRSLTAELCGPLLAGDAAVELSVLRAGNAVTTTAIRFVQQGEIQAHGVGVLGKSRMRDRDQVVERGPALTPWRDVPVATIASLAMPGEPAPPKGGAVSIASPAMPGEPAPPKGGAVSIAPSSGPSFAQHFEMRIVRGAPFAGGSEPIVEGWVQPKRAGKARDAAYLAACIDCFYPCLFAIETTPRPMATIAFTFQPFEFSGDPDAPLAYRARMVASENGYCVEFRELWTVEGRLVALNQQTMVIIK